MPPAELASGMLGLLWVGMRNAFGGPRNPANAEEALIALYGAPLYRSFFEDFTGRYWGKPPRLLSADFVARKMPRLTALDAVRQLLGNLGIKLPAPRVESAPGRRRPSTTPAAAPAPWRGHWPESSSAWAQRC